MKASYLVLAFFVAAAAAVGGWFAAKHQSSSATAQPESANIIYSCSMHPQVRSPRPGKCPFCGMELAPLNQLSQAGLPSGSVMLSSNRITVLHVQTAEAQRHPLRRTLRVAGTIEDNDVNHRFISAYVDGRIDRLFVNYVGAEVAANQPLATLFSPMLLAVEREYVALTKQNPPPNLPELHADHERLLAGSRLRLKQMGLNDDQIATLPAKEGTNLHTEIRAPISGTVVGRNVYEGQYVKEGEKLFELADFSTMWFKFDAYEQDLTWLRPGQTVEITTPSVPGKTFSAPIVFIDPNINDPTRSAKVRVELPNPSLEDGGRKRRELFHRLYAEGSVKLEVPEVLTVPRTAVLAPGPQALVYLARGDNTFEQRRIRLGRSGDEAWEVLEGLKPGDRVVTAGNLLIDAQAQLDSSSAPDSNSPPPTSPAPASLPPLTGPQRERVTQLVSAAHALAAALASDQVPDFNQQAAALSTLLPSYLAAFTNAPAWQPLVHKVSATAILAKAPDLAGARQSFLPFSMAMTEFTKAVRLQEGFQSIKIYKCPMAPKPGQTAFWVQLQGPLRNPYYGSQMIDCGSEVTP